ncbi:hypothetical protein DNTS_003340 [Danionella cerebrum]|uniref:GRIP domain-containing protein n=1 Tax=Danionella cerebrum TaxID=2873325 RepID=A0A553QPJ9_9TELE|nr:hypothetical protein DNTS_003340 [Danionella translucida]TRY91697.1 hypothetical protein DNTS_003340 [Danionella translucida]
MMEDSPAVAQSSGRSKLDSLSREDLIVFAKKQVLATQKFRSRCTDLEKELQGLKDVPSSESTLIQVSEGFSALGEVFLAARTHPHIRHCAAEVSERMEGVLLEKAEAQQSLARLQKQHQELLGLTQVVSLWYCEGILSGCSWGFSWATLGNFGYSEGFSRKVELWLRSAPHTLVWVELHYGYCWKRATKPQAPQFDFVFNLQETERKLAEAEGRSAALQEELYQRHEEKSELQTKLAEHKESIADYKSQLSRAQEELEVTKKNWISSEETLKDENQRWVLCIKDLREELEESKDKWIRAEEALKDELEETRQSCLSFEEALAEEQQRRSSSVESLQEDLEKLMRENQGYEEEIRFLEDQLVALQDELAMKDGVLQELQEEDEEPRKQPNMMMMMIEQEELQLLRNLKLELETEIHTIREEFSLEREELEFKIHELQTHRDQETDMEPTGGKRGERHWSQSGNQHLNTIIGVHEEEPVEESCREDQQMSVVFTDERDGDTRQEEPAEESSREEPQNPEQSWCEEMECTANMTDQTVCREESCKKDEQEPDEQEVREDQKITVPGGEELLEGEAANCLKEIRALTVRTTASMLDLQELLKSLLQEQRIEKEEPCTSHEDLMRRSEEILRNLWHQETLQTAALQAQLKHARDIRLLRSELGCVSEERNSLQEQLFNVQKHISEFLLQNTTEPSEESTGEPLGDQGVCDMVSRFCCRVKELKAMEGELLLHAEKLLQEKVILKDHLEEVLSDSEVVRRNLNVAQELNLKLSEENLQLQERVSKLTHRLENIEDKRKDDVQEDEPNRACRVLEECKHGEDEEMAAPVGEEAKERDEEQVPENNAGGKEEEILKSLADRDALISQLREEIHHLKVLRFCFILERSSRSAPVEGLCQHFGDSSCKDLVFLFAFKGNQYSSVTGGRVEDTRASSEEMEKLKNESREKDERMNKIKAVAVKAKKELDSSRKQVRGRISVECASWCVTEGVSLSLNQISVLKADVDQLRAERDRLSSSVKDIIHGAEAYKSLMEDYDRQVEQLDQEHEKLQQMEKLNQDLATQLQQREDLAPRLQALQSSVHLLESNVVELQKLNSRLECELASERILREQKSQEQQCASREVQELRTQLCSNTHALQEALQELEQLRKAAHQSSVLSVELSQLDQLLQDQSERIHDREQQLEERDALLQAAREREQRLSQEIDDLQLWDLELVLPAAGSDEDHFLLLIRASSPQSRVRPKLSVSMCVESESVKLLQDQAEERAMRMKTLLLKSKKELADAKQREASQESTLTSLRAELELQQQHLEHHKTVCIFCRTSPGSTGRDGLYQLEKVLCSDLHRQVSSLKDELNKSSSSHQMSLRTLQQELHTAQGDLASSRSEFESYKVRVHNVLKQQKNKSSSWIDPDANRQEREQLECLLEQLRGRLQETEQNLQSSTMELEQLQHTHSTLLERHTSTLQESVSREAQLRERLLTLQAEHSHCSSHLSAQLEVQRSSSREQIRLLQEQHCRALEQLQLQTSSLETQLLLQRENSGLGTNRRSVSDRKCAEEEELQSSPREEGEGMEMIESEPTASTSKHPLPSLEELLNTHELLGACQSDRSGSENQEDLSLKLSTASKSLEHLSSLLRESEASNAILMEQTTLLKSEVRRLERNDQRKELDSNLEYLKNVVLQFVLLRPGSERQALLPVLHRLLQLSPEERSRLAAAAQGEELSSAARGSGWSSYLHSWSGIR